MADDVSLTVGAESENATLAAMVRSALPGAAWSKARELCESGRVRVDGEIARDHARRLRAGQRVEVTPTGARKLEGALTRDSILYVDSDVVVVRKPVGVLTCPYQDGDRDTLSDRMRLLLAKHEKARGKAMTDPMVGVVQRLDKDTTGALVFARTMSAKRSLEEQLRAHTVIRRYVAIAHGNVLSERHETTIVQDRGDGLRGSWGRFRGHSGSPPREAKVAVTFVRPIEPLEGATLVECRLETGRQHQIRIHLSEVGHPLVGEQVYVRDYQGVRIEAPRPMLHAIQLGFVHPRTGAHVRFEDPLPSDFQAQLERLRR